MYNFYSPEPASWIKIRETFIWIYVCFWVLNDPEYNLNTYIIICILLTLSLGSFALLLTRPYISCSEAPTGLRALLCLLEVSCVTPRSGEARDTEADDDEALSEVRGGLTAPAPVRLVSGTQRSGGGSASLNLRSLRPTPASCIISIGDIWSWGTDIRIIETWHGQLLLTATIRHPPGVSILKRGQRWHSDFTATGNCNNFHLKSSGVWDSPENNTLLESCDTSGV